MMNNEMMRQLQARIQKMQDDLAQETIEASAGGGAVTVTISEIGMGPAQAKIQHVKISPEAVDPEDIETLEDLVVAAVNEALSKAQKMAADKMAPLTGGMSCRVCRDPLTPVHIEPIARAVEAFASLPGDRPQDRATPDVSLAAPAG